MQHNATPENINQAKMFIVQVMTIVQQSISRHKNRLREVYNNTEAFINSEIPDIDWPETTSEDKTLICTAKQQQIALGILATTSDLEQLNCCVALLDLQDDLSFKQANQLFSLVTDRIAKPADTEPTITNEVKELQLIEAQLEPLKANRAKSNVELQQITSLSSTYTSIFKENAPTFFREKEKVESENIKRQDVLIQFLESRLSILVTGIKSYLNFPVYMQIDKVNDELKNQLTAIVTKHQAMIKEDVLQNPRLLLNEMEPEKEKKLTLT